MAIGSPDKAARLRQLRTYARCQVWSGYRSDAAVRADVYDAALAEVRDAEQADALTEEVISSARQELAEAAHAWPERTSYDRLQEAISWLREEDVVVLEGVDDHWTAAAKLEELSREGHVPAGVAYFTHPDIWHAVEHGMLEINLWHGSSANVAPGEPLLDLVLGVLRAHGIGAVFDEGRIEATVSWQRRPTAAATRSSGH